VLQKSLVLLDEGKEGPELLDHLALYSEEQRMVFISMPTR
jgi:hypothetical protein